uniref:Uncharacterized protein n=1 Tax=Rhizophora mucronata TaxID=61149 RepID=A0A2P2R3S4_RHIMU
MYLITFLLIDSSKIET